MLGLVTQWGKKGALVIFLRIRKFSLLQNYVEVCVHNVHFPESGTGVDFIRTVPFVLLSRFAGREELLWTCSPVLLQDAGEGVLAV